MEIAAIETNYAGYRFRSRLEARWAVFFDALSWPWQYEPEGFKTSAGYYLPDFKIAMPMADMFQTGQGDVYLEVKGAPLRMDEAERLRAFACDPGDRWVFALGGIPHPCSEDIILTGWGQGHAGYWYLLGDLMGPDSLSGPLVVFEGATRLPSMQAAFRNADRGHMYDGCSAGRHDRRCPRLYRVGKALTAARSARFEHGESG